MTQSSKPHTPDAPQGDVPVQPQHSSRQDAQKVRVHHAKRRRAAGDRRPHATEVDHGAAEEQLVAEPRQSAHQQRVAPERPVADQHVSPGLTDVVTSWGASRPAFLVGSIYFVLSGFVGEWFPFSQVPMYSAVANEGRREQAAVPLFRAGDQRAEPQHFERFKGSHVEDILPWDRCRASGECRSYPCSMGYVPEDAVRWISDNLDDPAAAPGPVEVTYVYLLIEVQRDGSLAYKEDVVWRGTAWPRK